MIQPKIEYDKLSAGYEFAPTSFKLEREMLTAYLKATEDETGLYEGNGVVPPMAIAALAMAAISTGLSLPPGTIHVSQELEFIDIANIGETLTSYARINRKVERGKLHILTIGINVLDKKKTVVMTGECSFILPAS